MTLTNSGRTWLLIQIEVANEHEEMASWLMIHKLGANGCELSSASDGRSLIQASFESNVFSENDLSAVNAVLDEYGLGESVGTLKVKTVEEEDWLAEWKRGFTPLPIGDKFLICPPWLEADLTPEQRERHVILIEPGLAFGTGFHATTQFCLQALEQLTDQKRIVDVGTGSGILAIGAAMLLPDTTITAIEIDPEACKVARENLRLNKVADRIFLIEGEPDKVREQRFEVILSNLTCEDNVALLPEYMTMLEPGGHIIMSGILEEKAPRLRAAVQQHPLSIVRDESDRGWTGLVVANTTV
ncbi:MAG: 50S ribosomal protein L11 methyltransferase [Candidatus Obscuribacterales bacterium]|nr:50S ribosomal protein L11 methyltransferase [Candidatus Obscuribacterales bacterium]